MKEFDIKKYIDKNYEMSKSYINHDSTFNTSRCRIEPQLFSNLVYEHLFNDISTDTLCEKYLNISRSMNKNFRQYRNSSVMDYNALLRLLKIKKRSEIKEIEYYEYDSIKYKIDEYINNCILEKVDKNSKMYSKWINYYINSDEKINLNDKNKKSKFNLDEINIFEGVEDNYSKINDEITFNKRSFSQHNGVEISNLGKQIVLNYLNKIHDDVKFISRDNTLYPYDFEFNENGEKMFVKVKTTIDPVNLNFTITRNQLNFYNNNKNNYYLIFVRNLNLNNNDDEIVPFINIIKNPEININDEIVGFKDNKIFIRANTFCNY